MKFLLFFCRLLPARMPLPSGRPSSLAIAWCLVFAHRLVSGVLFPPILLLFRSVFLPGRPPRALCFGFSCCFHSLPSPFVFSPIPESRACEAGTDAAGFQAGTLARVLFLCQA